MTGIVVGVDGSAGSAAALRWAVSEAARSDREVVAVNAWTYPGTGMTADEVRDARRRALGELADQVRDEGPGVKIRTEVVEGDPVDVLLSTADGAAMLVVGRYGYGRISRALLGSVGAQCVRRAQCPVVIIPAARGDRHPLAAMEAVPRPIL
ncbi:universal stress protein [Amycolatopsis thermophila]|uniref:Nucleotide-binding universal stress UspA family protein n=1 Tax=Amycolatopsis thermophila TaxID=206084 RepID=A0ABU0F2C0_9PSEU|nr:universal stress protein [Amycolatopsis thermophila]MDQ0381172.1 nucleotide-binding universal stress UspA family protein [Amycolatopsis thermophila]